MSGIGAVNNASGGVILGGVAAAGHTSNFTGYAGGDAIHALATTYISNRGIAFGGNGGSGAYPGQFAGPGGAGGAGGAGVRLIATGTLVNANVVYGGSGGEGGAGQYYGGAGGQGGAGVIVGTGGKILTSSVIYGGSGGAGGVNKYVGPLGQGVGGLGGTGGDGVVLNQGGDLYVLAGHIQGGFGGKGVRGGGGQYGGMGGGGVGAYLKAGGLVSVSGGAAIDGGEAGVNPNSNYTGTGGVGVYLRDGGTVTNHGVIAGGANGFGGFGVELAGAGNVFNYGSIAGGVFAGGTFATGVILHNGGTVTNDGSIAGGVAAYDGGKIVNNGAMSGGYCKLAAIDAGAIIKSNASLVNGGAKDATASIVATLKDSCGVYVTGNGATVTNFGTISGAAEAVSFLGSSNTLIAEKGCVFGGAVLGGGGTLELASGKGDVSAFNSGGDVTVSGSMATTTFQNFGTLEIGKKANFSMNGAGTIASGQTLIDAGKLLIGDTLTVSGLLSVSHILGDVVRSEFQTLAIEGGTADFNAGASLGVTFVNVDGASTVNVATNLGFNGVWQQSTGTLNVSAGDTMTFDAVTFIAADDSFAGTFSGGGTVAFAGGTVSLSGLTVSAAAVTSAGATLTVGSGGVSLRSGSSLTIDSASTVIGAAATYTFTSQGMIAGAGAIGAGELTVINAAGGLINANTSSILTLDTGGAVITNNGTIESTGSGGLTIDSAIASSGQIDAFGGTVTVNGMVSAPGTAEIGGGTLDAASTFNQAVTFTTTTGTLELAHGQAYKATITGFAHSTQTYLDLGDIGFVSAGEATFSGTSTGGTLTITDGTHTASIALSGNYLSATFAALSDGHGGTLVHLKPPPASEPPAQAPGAPHALIAAMAALGAGDASGSRPLASLLDHPPTLMAAPRCALA